MLQIAHPTCPYLVSLTKHHLLNLIHFFVNQGRSDDATKRRPPPDPLIASGQIENPTLRRSTRILVPLDHYSFTHISLPQWQPYLLPLLHSHSQAV